MSYFAGLDVSLRSVSICVIDEDGKIAFERSVPFEIEDVVACLRSVDGIVEQVGFEAGVMSQYLYRGLETAGFDTICMEARQVAAALSAMRNKTDKNDARGIAQVLRSGWFSEVHIKSCDSHYDRALLTSRKTVLRKCIDLEQEVRGLMRAFGVRLPSTLSHRKFEETVLPIIEDDDRIAYALMPMIEAWRSLYASFLELDRRVKATARKDPICLLLMTAPGVGPMTALTFKAAVDDPSRFKSSRIVGAHFGLTPRRFQSGEKDQTGHISRAGDADVREALYSAANSLLMRTKTPSHLKTWGMRLVRSRGRRRATVALARKLAVILHRMWVDGKEFQLTGMEVHT
tara:strand:- start:2304 stop:3338 length:1035 start_codon:yes stop_codon:yes gene_type:complete